MPERSSRTERPVLLAASTREDQRLLAEALAELRRPYVVAEDGVDAMLALGPLPDSFAALVAADRVGRVSGFTLCGLARDAGATFPLLLLTGDESQATAERAARLRVSLLWLPVSSRRVARALRDILPRLVCSIAPHTHARFGRSVSMAAGR